MNDQAQQLTPALPQQTALVIGMQTRAQQLVEASQRAAITDLATHEQGLDLIKLIKVALKKSDDERTALVEKHNKWVKFVNGEFKERITTPLTQAETRVRVLCEAFLREQKKLREAEEKQAREALEVKALELASAAEAKGETQTAQIILEAAISAPVILPPSPAAVPSIARGQVASGSTQEKWYFDVVDFWLIPREYIVVTPLTKETVRTFNIEAARINGTLISQAIKAGTRSIPGLHVYSEDKLTVR